MLNGNVPSLVYAGKDTTLSHKTEGVRRLLTLLGRHRVRLPINGSCTRSHLYEESESVIVARSGVLHACFPHVIAQ